MENNSKKFKGLSENQSAQLSKVIEYFKANGYGAQHITDKPDEVVLETSKPGVNVSVTLKKSQ